MPKPLNNVLLNELVELQRRLHEAFTACETSLAETEHRGSWAPAADIVETPDRVLVQVDLPGVDPDDVEVTLDRSGLLIRGSKRQPFLGQRPRYVCYERTYGSFKRRLILPPPMVYEETTAVYEQGILTITLKKVRTEHHEPQRIPITKRESRTLRTVTAPTPSE